MKPYIPKQPKQVRERIEAKLEARLVRQLERYCRYLDSDRDYVLGQLLELVFKKDKSFAEWLSTHEPLGPGEPSEETPALPPRRTARKSAAAEEASAGTYVTSVASAPGRPGQ